MAILAIGLAGAGLGSAIGIGASLGWMGAVMAGNMLLGGKGQTIEGPRLDDLSVQSSAYGSPIPLVYGSMRIAGNIIWANPIKEKRKKKKAGGKGGGGPTQVSYSYSASFAVGLCAGPIETVLRIWADTKLVYDATAANDKAVSKYPSVIRIHTGTESQLPDSTIEMALGAGNVPAYRGLAYLVFSDLPLADFANRIPNISVEVVGSGDPTISGVLLPVATSMSRDGGYIDQARGTLVGMGNGKIHKYDLINNRLLNEAVVESRYGPLGGIDSNGYFYHMADESYTNVRLVKRHPDTLAVVQQTARNQPYSISGEVRDDKIYAWTTRRVYNTDLELIADLSGVFPSSSVPMCQDGDGNYWQVSANNIRKLKVSGFATDDSVAGLLTTASVTAWTAGQVPRTMFYDDTTGHIFFTLSGGRLVKWHPEDGFVASLDGMPVPSGYGLQGDANLPIKGWLWAGDSFNVALVDLVSMHIERTLNIALSPVTTATRFAGCYEKFTHSMVIMTDAGQAKYPLDRYTGEGVPLSGIIGDLTKKAGLVPADIDTATLTQSVRGFTVGNRMAARDALEPLLGAMFVDAVESDGVLRFIQRQTASALAVAEDDLGADDSGKDVLRITETRTQNVELPQRIDVVYLDPSRDYQTNTQHATRIAALGTAEKRTVQLAQVLSADEAKLIAERMLHEAWIGRTAYAFTLPPKFMRIDPADVVTVTLGTTTFKVRLQQADLGGNNAIACQGMAADEVAYSFPASGTSAVIDVQEILLVGPLVLALMDLPMLRLEDDSPGLMYGFGMKDGTASLYRAPDEVSWDLLGTGEELPHFGAATTVLPVPLSPWSWDETSNVTVSMREGELASAPMLDVLNGANAALLGDEIIQFRTATMLSGGVYRLTGLLRGRRGTEWACGSHSNGDRFILLEAGTVQRLSLPLSDVAKDYAYKGVMSGADWDDAPVQHFTFKAQSLKCLSPVHVTGSRSAGNLTISWIRRTRWYGDWLDGIDVPLFEASEAYQVDILNGATVVRTLSVTSPSAVYAAADQVTDFGTAQSSVSVKIYQMNAVIGRGNPATATV